MQLKWTDVADADLDHIEDYITKENSPLVAVDIVLTIIKTTAMILSDHPEGGRLGRLQGTRELVIDGIPFVVIYRKVESLNRIEIVRVLHDAQQWPPAG